MRIGLDARFLTHPQVGGFKTYTVNLVQALQEIDQDNHYILYLDREPTDNTNLPQQNNFTYQVVDGTAPVIGVPLREQVKLRRHISRDKLDLVHFLCNTAPVNIKKPYIITLHDTIQVANPSPFRISTNLSRSKQWAIAAYSKWTIKKSVYRAARVITVSNYEKQGIENLFKIKPEKICVTHLAPDSIFKPISPETLPRLRQSMRKQINLPERFILGVGHEPRKSIPLLIEAFAQVARNQQDLHLVIVAAEESRRVHFRQIAQDLGLGDRVLLLGMTTPDVMVNLYNLAQVFVFPSERESFGLPPLESIACGTPTIAMDVTSIPEILENGTYLLKDKNPKNWARAIKEVLSDELMRQNLYKRGLARAATFTWRRCAVKTIAVYQSVFQAM